MGLLTQADALLRSTPAGADRFAPSLAQIGGMVVLFGGLYGALMGTFGGLADGRLAQVLFSAGKVPVLFLATFLLSLPSYFVLNTLFGVRADFHRVARALLMSQAGLAITLVAFAPFTLLWYASSAHYPSAILFNALIFGLASLTAQRLLYRYYGPLIAQDERHRLLLRLWLVVYAFVGIQMGWVLRPFIGNPLEPVRFFREDAWGNAYLVILQLVSSALSQ